MNNKFFVYALGVTLVVTFASWMSMFAEAGRGGNGSWRSHSSGGHGSYGGGYSGGYSGGHK
jgi:hypothetical protein